MAKKIGLVLALDGEKEYRDALKACKDETKAYRDTLKELDQKFKDGKGTLEDYQKKQEQLTQKQEAYVKQLDQAKTGLQHAQDVYKKQAEQLDKLRDQLDKAREAQKKLEEAGKTGTEEYRKQTEEVKNLEDAIGKQAANCATAEKKVNSWTREVNAAEKGIEQCNVDLKQNKEDMERAGSAAEGASGDMDHFAKEVDEAATSSGKLSISLGDMVKNKVIDLAGDALRELGEKAIEAAKYVIEVGSNFEAQMSKVGAISGASAQDMQKLTDLASEMGRTTKFTATEAGEALEYMGMAGFKTSDMIAGLKGVMSLAAASGEDLGTTSDIVTDALTAFGESASESGRLADIMAAASSNANTNVSMMGETFKYAAPVAGALGYSMEDTAIAIGLMANAGIKASSAGTALRAGMTNLVKPSKQAAEAMEQYKISVTDDDGKMLSFRDLIAHIRDRLGGLDEKSQAAAAAAIFGKNAMSGWLAIINAAPEDLDKLTYSIDNSAGSANRMAEAMQDNLQGKLTLFNSALEGLGVQLYSYFSGPLSNVVELATGFINGITNALNPQKTALDSFIASVEASNAAVEKSIEHARATVSQGEAHKAEIEAYESVLDDVLTSCEQFNYVDLGNGKYQILDATGAVVEEGFQKVDEAAGTTEGILDAFASGGLNTKGIEDSSDSAVKMIGYVAEKAGDASGEVDALQGDIEQLRESGSGLSSVADGFGNVEESARKTYVITDELTKTKISAIVEALGSSVEGLAEAWNAQTGELTASHEELLKWFDTAKEVAMYDALENALHELYDAWGEAAVNVAKDQGIINEAIRQYNEENGTAYKTILELNDATGILYGGYGELGNSVRAASENLEDHTATLNDAETELNSTAEALEPLKKKLEETGEKTKETTGTVEEGVEALDAMAESEDGAAESADALVQEQEVLTGKLGEAKTAFEEAGGGAEYFAQKQAELGESDALLEWAEEQTELIKEIISSYEKMTERVQSAMDSYVNALDTSGEEGSNVLDNMVNNMTQKTKELHVWVENMRKLGEMAGKELPQGLYDELAAAGPGKTMEAVQAMVDAAESKTGDFERVAEAYEKSLEAKSDVATVASWTSAGKAYSAAVASGLIEAQPELDGAITETITSGVNAASDAAENFREAGEKAIESQSQGMESKSGDVEDAARTVAESAKAATDTAVEKFSFTGKSADVALARGISEDSNIPVERSRKLIEEIKKTIDDAAKELKGSGEESMRNYADGISNMGRDATGAVREIINEATGMLRDAREDYRAAGEDSIGSYSDALWRGEGEAISAASSIGRESAHEVANFKYDWDWAGYDYSTGLANGIYNGESQAINAAITVATNALIAAKNTLGVASPAKELIKVGQYWDEGLAIGMQTGKAVDAAKDSAKEALEAARDELSTGAAIDLTNQIDIAGNRQIQRIMDTDIQMADTASAMRGLSSAAAAISDLANSLTNPQAPNVTVMIGNREFKGYIVTTAMEGMASKTAGIRHSMGGVA